MCCNAVAATPRDGRRLTVSSEEAVRVPRRPAGAHCQPIVVITSLAYTADLPVYPVQPAVSCTAEPSLNAASRCCRVVSYLREALADVTQNETTRYRHIVCHALCDDILPGVSEEGLPAAASIRARGRALLVRSPYYECNVWGYAVLPGVDISCRADSHAGRIIKLLSPNM